VVEKGEKRSKTKKVADRKDGNDEWLNKVSNVIVTNIYEQFF